MAFYAICTALAKAKNILNKTNMNKQKNRFGFCVWSAFAALCVQVFAGSLYGGLPSAFAENQVGDVVINEVSWAGSSDNSNDEWIELYNTTSAAIDLSGWYLEDDYVVSVVIESGVVPAHGYFLIEDSEVAVSNVAADLVAGLSLANSGDSLILKDSGGSVVDSVNSGGGSWYAGDGTSKASMERIDPLVIVDSAANFASCESGNGSVGSGGSSLLGTPGSQNSAYQGSSDSVSVEFDLSDESPLSGETITATVIVNNAVDLYSYGFDVVYDPLVLDFSSASEESFLSSGGQASTAFNYGLEDGVAGKLVVGSARLVSPASGVSGSGNLFTLSFSVIGEEGTSSDLVFGGGSFAADSSGDLLVTYNSAAVSVGSNQVDGVSDLVASEGVEVYSLGLSWSAPAGGADSYIVYRQEVDESWTVIGTSVEAAFLDSDDLSFGGALIPGVTYQYQVRAVKDGIQSSAVSASGLESRGLVGDNNRSGRVDGRDLDNLARHYGLVFGSAEFDSLTDTTFDGVVDGSDLIDIGANFGLTI